MFRILLPALAAACLATAALAADPAMAQDTPPADHHGGMRGMAAMFSPQQMAMFMLQQHAATAGMNEDQRKAWRMAQRDKFLAMSAADKARMMADLEAKWDKLPADQKNAALDRMKKMQARRAAGGGMGHGDNNNGAQ